MAFLGLLDLKKDAVVGIDGQTIVLRSDDFIGVAGMPSSLHFISVRPEPNSGIAVGFIMSGELDLVRRYDPQTEEVSSDAVDALTSQNLVQKAQSGGLSPSSVVDYSKAVSQEQQQKWKAQTEYISRSQILERRGLSDGVKILPGAYLDDEEAFESISMGNERRDQDGRFIIYPDIPVIDTTISSRKHSHPCTKRYLRRLTPTERTELFRNPNVANRIISDVLSLYYANNWNLLLGDLQLAYSIFLYLQCLSSLEHWKNLVAMLSLVDPSGIRQHSGLYTALLNILPSQLSSMDQGFLEDTDEAGDNFLLPCLKALSRNTERSRITDEQQALQFERLLCNKFPSLMVLHADEEEYFRSPSFNGGGGEIDSDNESDAPVVVDMLDIQASLKRTHETTFPGGGGTLKGLSSTATASRYPLLVAAILPHEDILMTCARALDEKRDVSVVREAAAYLEDMERASS